MTNARFPKWRLAAVCLTAMGCAAEGAVDEEDVVIAEKVIVTGGRFGAYCQKSFQNGWADTLNNVNELCGWFVSQMDETASKIFYFNLVGKKFYLEQNGDHQPANDSADDVELLWIGTHGAISSTGNRALFAMWDEDVSADSTNMRYGDSPAPGGGVDILAAHSCDVLKHNDDKLAVRWGSALRGGLRMIVGSHDTLNDSVTTNEVGEDFADEIQHKASYRNAWKYAVSDIYSSQDATVVATGTSSSNCASRRDGMNWENSQTYARLRDGAIDKTCWWYWDNL